jgi:GT2 family glycosyltransferase
MEKPDISIVIVSWNTKSLLDECLESVYRTITVPSFDVWVVDNASSDGSMQMVREK